jgi:hypothetical protein
MFPRTEKLVDHIATIVRVNVRATEYRAAVQAILEAGDATIPILERLLNHRDLVVRHRSEELLDRIARLSRMAKVPQRSPHFGAKTTSFPH